MTEKAQLLDSAAMHRTLLRMAHEILEKNGEDGQVCLVGIYRRGVPLADELADNIEKLTGRRPETGTVDISLYRDDLSRISSDPSVNNTKIPFSVEGKTVILVDDVIYTGRTIRAAMEALISLGRPAKIQLAVLIDRGHRELPIRGDFVGKNVPTSKKEVVAVRVTAFDGEDRVCVCE